MRHDLPSFRIDKKDFLKGNNLYDDYPEGGMLASSFGMNTFGKPGLMAPVPALGSSVTGSLPSGGVISWYGSNTDVASGAMAVMVDGSGNGYYYNVDSAGNFTINGSADTGSVYAAGVTDTVLFKNQYYTTTKTDIVFNDRTLTSLSRNVHWWTVTKAQSALDSTAPHPIIVLGSLFYVADADALHSWDGTTITHRAFVLDNNNVYITALCVYSGFLYIAVQNYNDTAGALHGRAFVRIWDGFSKGWNDEIEVDYRINAFFVYKNILYMFSPYNIQYFFRRRFHVIHPLANQVYKCHITTTADSMFYVDGRDVMRYGSPFAETIAQEKFYKYFRSNANAIMGIFSWYQNSMHIVETGTNSSNYFVADVNAPTSTSTCTVDFNPKFFPYPVRIRSIFLDGKPLAAGQSIQIEWIDSNGNTQTPEQALFSAVDTTLIGTQQKRMDIGSKAATRVVQPRVVITGAYYFRYIDFLYERSEDQLSK